MSQKGLAPIVILLLIAATFGYLIYFGKISLNKAKPTPVHQTTQPLPTLNETANWKTYTDTKFGYSFKYPANYKSIFKGGSIFYSPDAKFDEVTTAKTKGIEIGSTVYGPGEDLKKDTQSYKGPNTKIDATLGSKLILPSGFIAKAYVNLEDITVAIDYTKNNQNMKLIIWCGGENGDPASCENVLTLLLPTVKLTL